VMSKELQQQFEEESGYDLVVKASGDAGALTNKLVLTKDDPTGDAVFGIDNTFGSRAIDEGVLAPYAAALPDGADQYALPGDDDHDLTPVDTGNVCVNVDDTWFADKGVPEPKTLDDLVKPAYKDLLVTENAATSSPGLGFLLGTAAKYGDDGWQGYWKKLKANGVKVVDGWEQAYNNEFSGSAGGKKAKADRPLVVSYASSPPAEVLFAKPQPAQAPTGVSTGTCFRQTEFAGLLKGAKNEEGGKALLDFLISKQFQEDMPLNMFVNPVRDDAKLPEVFTKYAPVISEPATVAPEKIAGNREQWVKSWSSLVLK